MESNRHLFYQADESFLISLARGTKPTTVTRHYHDAYELYYLLDGERNYFIKDRVYAIKKGVLVFIGMNELHSTSDAANPIHERLLINFKDDFINDFLPAGGINLFGCFMHSCNAIKLGINEQIYIENLLFRMMSEYNKKTVGYDLYLKTMIIELLILLNRHIVQNPLDEFDHTNSQHKKVLEIVNYINSNYSEPQTLDFLSKKHFMSTGYLSRLFKQVIGFNFIEYVNNVRIKEGAKLLKETHLSITQIAGKVGFESTTHFGRVFKAITGQSPGSYRKSTKY